MFAPDNFENDPYGHLTNQGAHGGLVGIGLALIAIAVLPAVWAWLAVLLVYFVIWEVLINMNFRNGEVCPSWDWRDSVDDTSNVAGGAAVLIGALEWGYWAAAGAFAIWAGFLAISTLRRAVQG